MRIRGRWKATLATALFGLLCACKKPQVEEETKPPAVVEVARVQAEPIQRIIEAEGLLYPFAQANVVPKISAPVRKLLANRGDAVQQGQLLAVLESADLSATAAESKAIYQQAVANYRSVTASSVPEQVSKAITDLTSAEENLKASKRLYENRQQLQKEGALSRKLVDDANVSYVQAQSQYEVARKHLEALQSVAKQEQERTAQEQVAAAKAHYEGAAAQMAYAEVRSPLSGVVADRPAMLGDMASSGSPLFVVLDISRVIARANLTLEQASHLRVGDPATINQGQEQLPGKVTVVSPSANANATTIEVWIEAANPRRLLRPGQSVHLSIAADTNQRALLVPSAALLPGEGGTTAVMSVDSKLIAHQKAVTTGIRGDGKVELVTGASEGEQVVVAGGVGLTDGAKVIIEKAGDKKPDEEKKSGKDDQ